MAITYFKLIRSFTQLATLFTFELLEQQVAQTKLLIDILVRPPSKSANVEHNAPVVATPVDTAWALVTTADEVQQTQLRADPAVVKDEPMEQGDTVVRTQTVTGMRSNSVPVSRGEMDMGDYAGSATNRVERKPIVDETIREEKAPFGEHRVDALEHLSEIPRNAKLTVDCVTTNPGAPFVTVNKLVTGSDKNNSAFATMQGPTTTSAAKDQIISHEHIERRAYAIWEAEGRPMGRQLDNWIEAEREISALPVLGLKSSFLHLYVAA